MAPREAEEKENEKEENRPRANPNIPDNEGTTPLCVASSVGNKEVVEILVSANADVRKANKDELTPLLAFARWRD